MIAKKRVIRPGKEFDALIPHHPEHKLVMLKNPQIEDTMGLVVRTIKKTLHDTERIAPVLKGRTIRETCRNIYQFIIDYVQYEYDFRDGDIEAVERVRTPCKLWLDRTEGGDCEDYAIFISSVLTHLRVPHSLRITKYGNNPNWQHIYVVAFDGSDKYITVDPVVDYAFDREVPYRTKKDYPVLAVKGQSSVGRRSAPTRSAKTEISALAGIQYNSVPMRQTVDSLAFGQMAVLSGLGSDDAALREAFMSYVTRYNYKSASALSSKVQGVRNWLKSQPNNPSVLQRYVAIQKSQGSSASNAAINADIARLGIFGSPKAPSGPGLPTAPPPQERHPQNPEPFQTTAPTGSTPPQTTTFTDTGVRQSQVTDVAPMPMRTAGNGEGFQQYLTKKNMLIAAGVVGVGIVATKML